MGANLAPSIITVKELLEDKSLVIPKYQRPYKWTTKNVNQLLDDILQFKSLSAYRLGTIVFHEDDKDKLNIVDGQQRTITILLISLALHRANGELGNTLQKEKITPVESPSLKGLCFKNRVSLTNIKENYAEVSRRIQEFDAETTLFFYEKCELVKVVLSDISEAFQFFDSQNARGKDLDPHDLLKAFHLREMMDHSTEQQRRNTVDKWENYDSDELQHLFANYLFRVRQWSSLRTARFFTKSDVDVFKGVNAHAEELFPYAQLYRIGHFYTEGYNQDIHRKIDRNAMPYPFQLDQVIINGERFFQFVDHYKEAKDKLEKAIPSSGKAREIVELINDYEGKDRTGDQFVRNLFDCCLLYYLDKFGKVDIDRAVEKFFIWAYTLRLNLQSVRLASIDNRAWAEAPFMFKILKEAIKPQEVLNVRLDSVNQNRSTKTEKIFQKFEDLGYFHE